MPHPGGPDRHHRRHRPAPALASRAPGHRPAERRAYHPRYASADLFVFPSTTDTFGNVMLEAMASALPVVAADTAVSRELLGRGAGSWYRPGDPRELAAHIARWRRDPALRRAVGRAGMVSANGRSWERVFDHLFADYRTVVNAASEGA